MPGTASSPRPPSTARSSRASRCAPSGPSSASPWPTARCAVATSPKDDHAHHPDRATGHHPIGPCDPHGDPHGDHRRGHPRGRPRPAPHRETGRDEDPRGGLTDPRVQQPLRPAAADPGPPGRHHRRDEDHQLLRPGRTWRARRRRRSRLDLPRRLRRQHRRPAGRQVRAADPRQQLLHRRGAGQAARRLHHHRHHRCRGAQPGERVRRLLRSGRVSTLPPQDRAAGVRPQPRSQAPRRGSGSYFHPHSWFDRIFEIGIIARGLDGVLELVGGLLLLLVTPDKIHRLVAAVTQGELSEDPHDLVARYLLHTSAGLTGPAITFGALYLLLHGVVKVVLVVALLRNKLWAYPWMIAVLLTFIGYQLYRIVLAPSPGLIALTVFDAVITALTWREWRIQQRRTSRVELSSP